MYAYNNVVELNIEMVQKMSKKSIGVEAITTLNEWDKQQELDVATPLIKQMVQYLQPVPQIHEFAIESVADQVIKVDLALEFPEEKSTDEEGEEYISSPHKIVGFQIKSSPHMAEKHVEKYKDGVFYEGRYYPYPGAFWCTEINLAVLAEFANFVGGGIRQDILDALDMLERLKVTAVNSPQGKYIEYRRVQRIFPKEIWQVLQDLQVIILAGGRVFYRRD